MPQDDPFHLQRFVDAQANTYAQARSELAAGQKRSHWTWFIFPQIAGLGSSPMAQRFAIADLAEASAYLSHPVLGPRLQECTELVLKAKHKGVDEIFGYPDDLKFHSSVTLFAHAAGMAGSGSSVFHHALQQIFGGKQDSATLSRLSLPAL